MYSEKSRLMRDFFYPQFPQTSPYMPSYWDIALFNVPYRPGLLPGFLGIKKPVGIASPVLIIRGRGYFLIPTLSFNQALNSSPSELWRMPYSTKACI